MRQDIETFESPFARWSRTVGVFSLEVLIAALVMHRLLSLPTPVAINIFVVALAGAAIAILLALGAFVAIWRDGRLGTGRAALGLCLGLGLIAWPLSVVPTYRSLPLIHDVTTDTSAPPAFVALAKERARDANRPQYAGAAVAQLQQEAYPDIRPVIIPRPVAETWELLGETIHRLRWKVANETAPGGRGKPGYIEAVDRTLILGFYDDVVIRVDGDARETRVDVRSASRYGEHDFGRNAQRIRRLFKELDARMQETVAGSDRQRRKRGGAAVPKRAKGSPALSQAQKQKSGPGQRGSRRELQQKETQRGRAVDRVRGKQSQRYQE